MGHAAEFARHAFNCCAFCDQSEAIGLLQSVLKSLFLARSKQSPHPNGSLGMTLVIVRAQRFRVRVEANWRQMV